VKKTWIILAIGMAALVSCGGQKDNGGGSGTNFDPSGVAKVLGTANEQLDKLTAPLAGSTVPIPLAPVLANPFSTGIAAMDSVDWSCDHVVVSGNTADADSDGIPVDATFNGRCTWSYAGGGETISGYWQYDNLKVQDPDDHDSAAGIKASGQVEWGVTSGGSSITFTWTLRQHDLVKSGGSYHFDYEGEWRISVGEEVYTFGYEFSGTWTPDDASKPWGNGTMSGTSSFNGNGPSCSAGWSVTATISAVHYADCGINSGQVDFQVTGCDGGSCNARIIWDGCDTENISGSCFPD